MSIWCIHRREKDQKKGLLARIELGNEKISLGKKRVHKRTPSPDRTKRPLQKTYILHGVTQKARAQVTRQTLSWLGTAGKHVRALSTHVPRPPYIKSPREGVLLP